MPFSFVKKKDLASEPKSSAVMVESRPSQASRRKVPKSSQSISRRESSKDKAPVSEKPKPKCTVSGFEMPRWAAEEPILGYELEIIKNGVELNESVKLKDTVMVVGRADPPEVDIQLLHQSVSRKHAVIVQSWKGLLYLQDLGSTHGTVWNKRKMKKGCYCLLRPGDLIKFGESTRRYVVGGVTNEEIALAEEYAKEERKKKLAKFEEDRRKQLADRRAKREEELEMMNEDEFDNGDDGIYRGPLADDDEGLERRAQLRDEGPAVYYFNSSDEEYANMDSDEDEFYDRSKTSADATTAVAAPRQSYSYSYDELRDQIVEHETRLVRLADALEQKEKEAGNAGNGVGDGVDALDAYMKDMVAQFEVKEKQRIAQEKAYCQSELKRLRPLMEAARPAFIKADEEKATIASLVREQTEQVAAPASAKPPVPEKTLGYRKKSEDPREKPAKEPAATFEPPQPKKTPPVTEDNEKSPTAGRETMPTPPVSEFAPPPKRARVESRPSTSQPTVEKVSAGPPTDTIATGSTEESGLKSRDGGDGREVRAETECAHEEVWTPPVGQKGDGRTALNDKYGY